VVVIRLDRRPVEHAHTGGTWVCRGSSVFIASVPRLGSIVFVCPAISRWGAGPGLTDGILCSSLLPPPLAQSKGNFSDEYKEVVSEELAKASRAWGATGDDDDGGRCRGIFSGVPALS
jgi:hypothetical protein